MSLSHPLFRLTLLVACLCLTGLNAHGQDAAPGLTPIERPTNFAAIPVMIRPGVVTPIAAQPAEAAPTVSDALPPAEENPDVSEEAPEGDGAPGVPLPAVRPATDQTPIAAIPRPVERPSTVPTVPPSVPIAAAQVPDLSVSQQACRAQLRDLGVQFSPLANTANAQGCGLTNALEVRSFNGISLRPTGQLTCPAALATAAWLEASVVPAAQQHFRQRIDTMVHYSTYSCRARPSGRLSEHAFGNAIDVAKFQLADGREISIDPDWNGNTRASRFLRQIARTSCRFFKVILTPDSDAAHFNHFHLDTGRWSSCPY